MLNTVFKHGLLVVVLCRSGQGEWLPCRSLGFECRRRLFYTFESKFFFSVFFFIVRVRVSVRVIFGVN